MNRFALICLSLLVPTLSHAQSIEARLQALSPGQWLSYDVPMQPGVRAPCCLEWKSRRDVQPAACRLEDRDWNFGSSDRDPVAPAGSTLRVLARRGPGAGHDRLHAIADACAIDPGNSIVVEAGAIDSATSLAFLSKSLAGAKKQREHAIVAVAYHAGDGADRLLASAARGDDERLRRDASFWLANNRGEFGYRTVRELIDTSAGNDELNPLVFALSISPVDEAKDDLRRLARHHRHDEVRGEALFWLAQDNDPQAEAILKAAVTGDASHAVRKKAVFALSQLPAERAVPALRELVERGASREVRKEALFWLAQVDDDAVLPVFDELLGESK